MAESRALYPWLRAVRVGVGGGEGGSGLGRPQPAAQQRPPQAVAAHMTRPRRPWRGREPPALPHPPQVMVACDYEAARPMTSPPDTD